MQAATAGYQLQDLIYRWLQEKPECRENLVEIVAWEEAHCQVEHVIGWEWTDVHCPVSRINMMVSGGIVDVPSKSRTYTFYRLRSLEETKAALAVEAPQETAAPVDVDSLFTLVVGHERIKQLLRYAIKADQPVSCLLVGPPGTAKTLVLSDIGRLPGAEFYVGSTTTKSGLVGLLLSARPRFLVIDELDKMDDRDMSPLLNLMETGMVTRLQHGARERITLTTRVFAGANDLRRLSAPIINRFAKFEIEPYSAADFVEVARAVLTQREGLGPETAKLIATEVVKFSLDIRDAVRVARMANGHPTRVLEIVRCLWPEGRGQGRIRPLRKE